MKKMLFGFLFGIIITAVASVNPGQIIKADLINKILDLKILNQTTPEIIEEYTAHTTAGYQDSYNPYFSTVVKNTINQLATISNGDGHGFVYTAKVKHIVDLSTNITVSNHGGRTSGIILNNVSGEAVLSSNIVNNRIATAINVTQNYDTPLHVEILLNANDTLNIRTDFNEDTTNPNRTNIHIIGRKTNFTTIRELIQSAGYVF